MATQGRGTRVVVARWLVAAGLTFALAGCAKKVTSVDASRVPPGFPEGVASASQLVVWPDTPDSVYLFLDRGPDGPNPPPDNVLTDRDSLLHVDAIYTTGPGAVQGMVFDYTQASGYQLFRRDPNGGFRTLKDFVVTPTKRWLDNQQYFGAGGAVTQLPATDLFVFTDQSPATFPSEAYIGRGVVAGLSSSGAPLTNLGTTSAPSVAGSLAYTGAAVPPDSLVDMKWTAVPGAAGYWIHIYQRRLDLRLASEVIASGIPSPLFAGKAKDFFIGYFPASASPEYKLGTVAPEGSRILLNRTLLSKATYFFRISAVDASGQMIATMNETSDLGFFFFTLPVRTFQRFRLGCVALTPDRGIPPPVPTLGLRSESGGSRSPDLISTELPNFFIQRQATAASGRRR